MLVSSARKQVGETTLQQLHPASPHEIPWLEEAQHRVSMSNHFGLTEKLPSTGVRDGFTRVAA